MQVDYQTCRVEINRAHVTTGCLVKSGSQAPVSLLETGHTCEQSSRGGAEKPGDCRLSFFQL